MEEAGKKARVSEKKDLIAGEAHDSEERHRAFERLKEINVLMKEKISHLITKEEKELEELEKKIKYNSIVTNREYPFCLYSEEMLGEMFKLNC